MPYLLLVDDEIHLLDAMDEILTDLGHHVTAVKSGEAALEALQNAGGRLPDLVIADIIMPGGITGFELLKQVRGTPVWADIPFLFISATITPDLEDKLEQNPDVNFLRKPFEIEPFCDLVEELAG